MLTVSLVGVTTELVEQNQMQATPVFQVMSAIPDGAKTINVLLFLKMELIVRSATHVSQNGVTTTTVKHQTECGWKPKPKLF